MTIETLEGGDRGPAATLAGHWDLLVAAALLGTDRRPPPPPPPGPLADAGRAEMGAETVDDATRLLDQVAALTAARRAGLRPGPAPAPLEACPPDQAPACPVPAGRRLAELLEAWPVLVDEWLGALVAARYRLPPEHTVTLLARYRADPRRRALVVEAAGPVADWVTDLFPELLAPRRPVRAARAQVGVEAEAEAASALPPDLAPLLEVPPAVLVSALLEGLAQGRWTHRHRSLLIRLVGSVDPGVLPALACGLATGPRAGPAATARDRAGSLVDDLAVLARTRADMLAELAPS